MIYRSEWWSVVLPPHWSGYPDATCSTFRARQSLGVLQISAAHKGTEDITDADLREFAGSRVPCEVSLQQCRFGEFSGFTARYQKGGYVWQEWWQRCGHLMVYSTYNVLAGEEDAEHDAVSSILASLKVSG